MGYEFQRYLTADATGLLMKKLTQQLLHIGHSAGVTTISGAEATGDDTILKSNTNDDYSYLEAIGDGWIHLHGKGGIALYEQTTSSLTITNSANKTYIRGGGITGDDTHIQANQIDDQGRIILNGNSNMYLDSPATTELRLSSAGTTYMSFEESGNDAVIDTKLSNGNLFFNCAGSGVVKFGTYSALGGKALAGYITILDSGGTTRYLGCVA